MRRLTGACALLAAMTLAALPATADPIGGATYYGVAADGAKVTFTVTSDGTLVNSYRITNVQGDTCQFTAEGDNGSWGGAPIAKNSFEYNLGSAIILQGTFPGAQSASGTFRLHNDATTTKPACDTGSVSWTATTSATPPPGGGGGKGGGGGGSGGHTPTGSGGQRELTTWVSLHKVSDTRLRGRVRSSLRSCRKARRVTLWRGSRRIAMTESRAGGRFSFEGSATRRSGYYRAAVAAKNVKGGICKPGSSTFIFA